MALPESPLSPDHDWMLKSGSSTWSDGSLIEVYGTVPLGVAVALVALPLG